MSYKDINKQREFQRLRNKRARAEFFAGSYCALCGGVEDLELDHINRSSKLGHNIWSWSIERRLAEIEKCQILCQKCHIKKSIRERGFIVGKRKHGNAWSHGCRCDVCKAWHRDYERKRLERKRVELSSLACHASVLPLNYRPII